MPIDPRAGGRDDAAATDVDFTKNPAYTERSVRRRSIINGENMIKGKWKTMGITLAVVLSGCSGSKQLSDGHMAYNEAVRLASDQEVLLNIVRLRYQDSVEFLATTSINSTISFSVELSTGLGNSDGSSNNAIGLNAKYSDTPTFSFSPQRGSAVAKRLNNPVDISTLVFLASVSRDTHHIFRLLVTWMNGLENESGSVDPQFLKSISTLTHMQYDGDALMAYVDDVQVVSPEIPREKVSTSEMLTALNSGLNIREVKDGTAIAFTRTMEQARLIVEKDAKNRDGLLADLNLDPSRNSYPIIGFVGEKDEIGNAELHVRTRSVLHAMAFLSQGVTVPPEQLAAGLAISTTPHGSTDPAFMNDIFRVWHSSEKPEHASAMVRHRGYWFYIKDNDETTRRTFFLITHALRFILEQGSQKTPVLTLPVAGSN